MRSPLYDWGLNTEFEETLKDTPPGGEYRYEAKIPVSIIELRGDGQSKPVLEGRTYRWLILPCNKANSISSNGRAKTGCMYRPPVCRVHAPGTSPAGFASSIEKSGTITCSNKCGAIGAHAFRARQSVTVARAKV